MKRATLTLLLFLFLKTGFSQDLNFNVSGFNARPVTKEKLNAAKTLSDINPGYPSSWITDYISSEISATRNGKIVKVSGTNDILNSEQRRILNSFDQGTDVLVEVKYKSKNAVTDKVVNLSVNFSVTIVPEKEAEYFGGNEKMKNYLKENAINKIPEPYAKDLQAVVRFIVNEEGDIAGARISRTSGDDKIDDLLLEAINKMPKWKPALDSKGIKVRQEFAFSVGNGGC